MNCHYIAITLRLASMKAIEGLSINTKNDSVSSYCRASILGIRVSRISRKGPGKLPGKDPWAPGKDPWGSIRGKSKRLFVIVCVCNFNYSQIANLGFLMDCNMR